MGGNDFSQVIDTSVMSESRMKVTPVKKDRDKDVKDKKDKKEKHKDKDKNKEKPIPGKPPTVVEVI